MEKKSILLVDDDAVVRDVIKGALEKEYNVLEASRYSDALEQSKNHIDLALIDYNLPDCDGFELLKVIREKKPSLPAIIITAYSSEDVAIKAIRAGATDYMKKPLRLAYLSKKVSEIFREKNNKGDIEFEYVGNKEEFIMEGVAALIEERYKEGLTRQKIAGLVNMNRNKFCVAFKKKFGQTFTSYLNSIRSKKAAELLKNHNLNITEIAYFVGYENIVHFERIFKREYGMSPKEYRKKLKGE